MQPFVTGGVGVTAQRSGPKKSAEALQRRKAQKLRIAGKALCLTVVLLMRGITIKFVDGVFHIHEGL